MSNQKSMRRICANRKCQAGIYARSNERAPILCASCRYLARWAFGLGAFIVGTIVALIKLIS
jgi:hypothetical protein